VGLDVRVVVIVSTPPHVRAEQCPYVHELPPHSVLLSAKPTP